MKSYAILISPRANTAYFNETIDTARAEFVQCIGEQELELVQFGQLNFFNVDLAPEQLTLVARLSFCQGVFERQGESLVPVAIDPEFLLHDDFVFGSKYKGKTSEVLTQLLLNVGLSYLDEKDHSKIKLLDPMCGRGTTLMWAQRYGIKSKGIEQDPKACDDFRTSLRKWSKLHRQKHKLLEGFIGKANKQNKGKFIDFSANDVSTRLINGDATHADEIVKNEKQHLIISDIPYGVQHFTTEKTRNPIAVLSECAPKWSQLLHKGGVLVIAYNKYIPKRAELVALFTEQGLTECDFHAPHRVSESIYRDIVVFKK